MSLHPDRKRRNIKAGRHPREVLLSVPNGPLREFFLASEARGALTASEVAWNAGWIIRSKRRSDSGDTSRLRRVLGLVPNTTTENGVRVPYLAEQVDYETGVALCHAMKADPVAVGV